LTRCSSMPSAETLVEPGRLDATYPRGERLGQPRALDAGSCPRRDGDSVGRQKLQHDVDVRRIADLEQRRAGDDDALAFLQLAQHLAGLRRTDLDTAAPGRGARDGSFRADEVSRGRRQLGGSDLQIGFGAGHGGDLLRVVEAGTLVGAGRGGIGLGQRLLPRHLAQGPAELCLGLAHLGLGEFDRGAGSRDLGFGLLAGANVEETRHRRLDHSDHCLVGDHLVARIEQRAPQFSSDRGRHDKQRLDARLAFLVDGDLQRPLADRREIHLHGGGDQCPCQHGKQQERASAGGEMAAGERTEGGG